MFNEVLTKFLISISLISLELAHNENWNDWSTALILVYDLKESKNITILVFIKSI